MVYTILVIVQVVIALSLVGLILVQHGKGADAGAAFGSGASGTVFGAKGSANFMTRATAALATIFFAISLTLAYLINGASMPTGSITDQLDSPPSSTLSDRDNNGVPGDETITDGQRAANRDNREAQEEAQSDSSAGDGSAEQQQSQGNGGDSADDAEAGAQIPE